MRIDSHISYDGAEKRLTRLGLTPLFDEVVNIIQQTPIYLQEEKESNGAAFIREHLDNNFTSYGGWIKTQVGGIDWQKTLTHQTSPQPIQVSLGVEIQVSGRSDMVIRDLVHFRNSLRDGAVDVGLIIVPSDRLQKYLPDRTLNLSTAQRYIEQELHEALQFPLFLVSIEHDGQGPALPKKRTKQ